MSNEIINNIDINVLLSLNDEEFRKVIQQMPNDEKKCQCIITMFSKTRDNNWLNFTNEIKDDFYKMQIRGLYDNDNYNEMIPNFLKKSSEYKIILDKIKEMKTEEEIYKYISSIDDKDIKTLFFYKTQDLSKRKMIVDSIEEDIVESLEQPTKLAQNMIIEYFKNNSNGKFTEKEMLELELIFKRTKVMYGKFMPHDLNGFMNHTDYTMSMNPDLCYEVEKQLLYLLHEYGHAISMKNFKSADYKIDQIRFVEEGMSDTFADLVMQSYQKNHDKVEYTATIPNSTLSFLAKIDLTDATIMKYSGYKAENELVRTMLYPLEKQGLDKEAVYNYYFDDKYKFFELTLGEEYASNLSDDFNKNPVYNEFDFTDIQKINIGEFDNIDEKSVYAYGNRKMKNETKQLDKSKKIIRRPMSLTAIKENVGIKNEQIYEEVVNYYEKYDINPEDDPKSIIQKLHKKNGEIRSKASGASLNPEIVQKLEKESEEISNFIKMFKPKNKHLLYEYNERISKVRKEAKKSGDLIVCQDEATLKVYQQLQKLSELPPQSQFVEVANGLAEAHNLHYLKEGEKNAEVK